MAQYATLKAAIDAVIKANGQREITGTVLNQTLNAMVNSLGADYQFAGVATPSTNPGTPDQNVFYLAFEDGTYTNFNATVLSAGISILMWNGSWSSQTFYTIDATPKASSNNLVSSGAVFDAIKTDGSAYDVSVHFPTGGPNSDGKFTLEYILSNADTLIPTAWRKGGMSIRFVHSSDNKYVQYRLMAQTFSTTVADWQGVDDEPTAASQNLVKSGGVAQELALGVVYDVTAHNSGATFASLDVILVEPDVYTYIPIAVRKDGMSIKFVSSVDNKCHQFRYMLSYTNNSDGNYLFSRPANWQGIDVEPAENSHNLVESGGVFKNQNPISQCVSKSLKGLEESVWSTIGGNNGGENLFYPTICTILPVRTCLSSLSKNVWDTKAIGDASFFCFYMPCKENTTYTVSNCSLDIVFFNGLKYKISSIEGEWQSQNTFTTPAGCCYFSIISNAKKVDLVIVEGSSIPQSIIPLIPFANAETGHQQELTNLLSIIDNNFAIPANLFSPNNKTFLDNGMIFDNTSANINARVQASDRSFYSFVLPVIPGKTYTSSMSGIGIIYFDKGGTKIKFQTTATYNAITFVVPYNCYYVGINSNINRNNMMVVEGDTLPSNYQTYRMEYLGNLKKMKLAEDATSPVKISDTDNFFIDGNGYCIDLGEHLTGTRNGDYIEIEYTASTTDRIYKVCVSKTLTPLDNYSSLSVGYNTTLWAHYADETKDFKLLPVVSMTELAQNENSFYYDGTKIYINISEDAAEYVLANDKSWDRGLLISNSRGKVENLTIKYSDLCNCLVTNGSYVEFSNCKFLYSSTRTSILAAGKSTVILNRCEAFKARLDGMDTDADNTISTMIQNDCHCHYCYDDGSSHHKGQFFINGGEYDHNHKGGISAPCYLSEGNITGAYIHDNDVNGVYAVNTQEQGKGKFTISNCLFKGNGRNFYSDYYDIISYNNVYADTPINPNSINHGEFVEYGI